MSARRRRNARRWNWGKIGLRNARGQTERHTDHVKSQSREPMCRENFPTREREKMFFSRKIFSVANEEKWFINKQERRVMLAERFVPRFDRLRRENEIKAIAKNREAPSAKNLSRFSNSVLVRRTKNVFPIDAVELPSLMEADVGMRLSK